MKILKPLYILLLSILLSTTTGCSSSTYSKGFPTIIPVHDHVILGPGRKESLIGHSYTGVQQNLYWWNCLGRYTNELSFENSLALLISTPIASADFILSAATDTLFLPADLLITPAHDNTIPKECRGSR